MRQTLLDLMEVIRGISKRCYKRYRGLTSPACVCIFVFTDCSRPWSICVRLVGQIFCKIMKSSTVFKTLKTFTADRIYQSCESWTVVKCSAQKDLVNSCRDCLKAPARQSPATIETVRRITAGAMPNHFGVKVPQFVPTLAFYPSPVHQDRQNRQDHQHVNFRKVVEKKKAFTRNLATKRPCFSICQALHNYYGAISRTLQLFASSWCCFLFSKVQKVSDVAPRLFHISPNNLPFVLRISQQSAG